MDKVFSFSNKRVIVFICTFIVITVLSMLITYWQLKPFAIKTDISQLENNDITVAGIFINNIIVSAIAVAGVILCRVPSIAVLIINPIVLGFALGVNWLCTNQILYFMKILIPHAIFEVPALSIACAIGTEGRMFTKKYSKVSMARAAGLIATLLMIAAFVECNISVGNI